MNPTPPREIRTAYWFLPLALIALAAIVSHGVVSRGMPQGEGGDHPTLLAALSRRPSLAFGFRNFLGDIVWLQAVQLSGKTKMAPEDYDRLYGMLRTVTRLDTRFVIPYHLGGIVLGDSPAHAAQAIDLLAEGEKRFPSKWRLPFYASYIYFFVLEEPLQGGEALMRASRIEGSPPYFPLLASRMLAEGKRPETALAFLREMLAQETDPRRRSPLEERIRRVVVERDRQILEHAVAVYRSRFGAIPGRLQELVHAGILPQIPAEPYGGRYLLSADGHVRSDRVREEKLKVLRVR